MAYRGRQTAGPWAFSVRCLPAIAAKVCVFDPTRQNPRKNPWQKIRTRISSGSERWRKSEKLRKKGRAVRGRGKRRRATPAIQILSIPQPPKNRNGRIVRSRRVTSPVGLVHRLSRGTLSENVSYRAGDYRLPVRRCPMQACNSPGASLFPKVAGEDRPYRVQHSWAFSWLFPARGARFAERVSSAALGSKRQPPTPRPGETSAECEQGEAP